MAFTSDEKRKKRAELRERALERMNAAGGEDRPTRKRGDRDEGEEPVKGEGRSREALEEMARRMADKDGEHHGKRPGRRGGMPMIDRLKKGRKKS